MRHGGLALAALLAACGSHSSGDHVTCGPGTELRDEACVPSDAGIDTPADADAPLDAALPADEATAFAIDPAHDNAQPADTIASPLAPAWTATLIAPVSYSLVVGGLVVVSAGDSPSTVSALDLQTGAVVWGPFVSGDRALLAYDRGLVFVLDMRGRLTARDLATGSTRWFVQVPVTLSDSLVFAPPVASGGMVYVNGPEMAAYDAQTGTLRWSSPTSEQSMGTSAVSGGVVYQAGACDGLYAWNAMTGMQLWHHMGPCSGGGGTAPAVYDGTVWERDGYQGNVTYDLGGTVLGTFTSTAAPAFDGGKLFSQSGGTVTAIDLATSNVVWTFTGDDKICTSPVIAGAGGQVFVGSSAGKVYELDETTGVQRSVHDIGAAVTCFSETTTLTLGENHLLVPVGNQLVAY